MASEPRYMTLPKLFEGHLFRVPDYQRGYSWSDQQLGDLWTDIELLDEETQHFTGMIVVEHLEQRKNKVELETYEVLEVIDGQQRLTTLVLLIQAAAREMAAMAIPTAQRQAEKLVARYIGNSGWRKLRLNDDSRAYFEHLLAEGEPLSHTENASQRNLANAMRYFRERLQALGDDVETRLAGIRKLVSRLQSDLRFVYYEVDDDAEAGLIFEVMNNRGKPLSEADRLKNYLMYLAHKVDLSDEDVKGIASKWGQVFKQVMRASPEGTSSTDTEGRLLRNHWILFKEAQFPKALRRLSISQRVRHDMLIKPVSDRDLTARNQRLGKKALRYTVSLVNSAHDFAEIFNPAAPGALDWVREVSLRQDLVRALQSFKRMGHTATAVPLLMAGRRRLQNQPELYLELATALSVYSFRVFAMCNRRGHTGQAHFRRLARDLYSKKTKADIAARTRSIVVELYQWTGWYGGDDELVGHLTHKNFYETHRSQEIRYLFYEYEHELCSGQKPAVDWATFSNSKKTQVEHIWARGQEWLGDKKKSHDKNVNRLGNLTVTHFNQRLGKKPFKEKKKLYAKSNLVIEHGLQKHRDWTLGLIGRREGQIVNFVLDRWPIP